MAVKGETKEKVRINIREPRHYRVVMHNDDFTPMDFVVEVLIRIFGKDADSTVTLMMSIHKGNYAVAGVYPKDIAQTKATEAEQWAREEGYPLKVEAVCQ